MKINKIKIAISIFSMLLSLAIFAQGRSGGQRGSGQGGQRGKPDVAKLFAMLDANNDDKIDKSEASKDKRGKISQDFEQIDTNNDSFIDLTELKASLNGRDKKRISAEKIMKEIDDNKDGKLNELEIAAKEKLSLKNNFKKIDTNQDNEIDLAELRVFYANDPKNKSKRKGKPQKRRN